METRFDFSDLTTLVEGDEDSIFRTLRGTATFAVYGLGAQPLLFTDGTTSNPFGSVGTSTASNGTTLAITLNSTALTAIATDQTSNIFIGGIDSGENSLLPLWDFANSHQSINEKVVLSLTTAAAVSEPSSLLALLSFAAVLTSFIIRRPHEAERLICQGSYCRRKAMHIIRKGQVRWLGGRGVRAAEL